jgi:2-methylisocitrate lyase-like PEP mutase family enzyme
MTQAEKALRFQQLHQRAGAFLIPNPWDAGSARILAGLGFEAFATSSGAAAATFGRRDGKISRDEALAHARSIASATDLPVSADLERGFADDPKSVAETVRLAANAGLAGCSIEDFTGDNAKGLYDISFAAERIAAAAEAARSLPFPFTLPPERKTLFAANRIWTTPSLACKPTKRPALMCYSRRPCRTSPPSARFALRCRSRSTSW